MKESEGRENVDNVHGRQGLSIVWAETHRQCGNFRRECNEITNAVLCGGGSLVRCLGPESRAKRKSDRHNGTEKNMGGTSWRFGRFGRVEIRPGGSKHSALVYCTKLDDEASGRQRLLEGLWNA